MYVDAEREVPHVVACQGILADRHAGVREEHVDAPELGLNVGEQRAERALIRDIGRDCEVSVAELLSHARQWLRRDVSDRHASTFRGAGER